MGVRRVLPVFALSAILLVSSFGVNSSFAESGNTQLTVTADLGSSIELEMEDPDGLRVAAFSGGGGILFGCLVTTHTIELPKTFLPITITMGDCQNPADQTVWEITETSATCVSGSCLPEGPVFLVIDEDSIDNGNPPNFFSVD